MAYAIWAGLGTALTTLIGVVVWGEAFSVLKTLGITLIGGVVLLNLTKNMETVKEPSS